MFKDDPGKKTRAFFKGILVVLTSINRDVGKSTGWRLGFQKKTIDMAKKIEKITGKRDHFVGQINCAYKLHQGQATTFLYHEDRLTRHSETNFTLRTNRKKFKVIEKNRSQLTNLSFELNTKKSENRRQSLSLQPSPLYFVEKQRHIYNQLLKIFSSFSCMVSAVKGLII